MKSSVVLFVMIFLIFITFTSDILAVYPYVKPKPKVPSEGLLKAMFKGIGMGLFRDSAELQENFSGVSQCLKKDDKNKLALDLLLKRLVESINWLASAGEKIHSNLCLHRKNVSISLAREMTGVIKTGNSTNMTKTMKPKFQKKLNESLKNSTRRDSVKVLNDFIAKDWIQIQKFIRVIKEIFFGNDSFLAKIVNCLAAEKSLSPEIKTFFETITKRLKDYKSIVLLGEPVTAFYGFDFMFGALCEANVVKSMREHAFMAIASQTTMKNDNEARTLNGNVLGDILFYIQGHEDLFSFSDILKEKKIIEGIINKLKK